MTTEEVREMLNYLNIAYPTFAKKLNTTERGDMLKAWSKWFADVDASAAREAANTHIRRAKFFPTPSDLFVIINEIEAADPNELFEEMLRASREANKVEVKIVDVGGWGKPCECQAVSNFTQGDFRKLREEIRRYVYDIDGLKAISAEYKADPFRAQERFKKTLPTILQTIERNKMLERMRGES